MIFHPCLIADAVRDLVQNVTLFTVHPDPDADVKRNLVMNAPPNHIVPSQRENIIFATVPLVHVDLRVHMDLGDVRGVKQVIQAIPVIQAILDTRDAQETEEIPVIPVILDTRDVPVIQATRDTLVPTDHVLKS